jgi:hypothetical protein
MTRNKKTIRISRDIISLDRTELLVAVMDYLVKHLEDIPPQCAIQVVEFAPPDRFSFIIDEEKGEGWLK